MAVHFDPPEDVDSEIRMLVDGHNPFGPDCKLHRRMQSVAWHYELGQPVVDLLVSEGFVGFKFVRAANPDGNEEAKNFYETAVDLQLEDKKVGRLQRIMTKKAFRRVCLPQPWAAVSTSSVEPPAKRVKSLNPKSTSKSGSSSATPAVIPAAAGPSAAAAPSAAPVAAAPVAAAAAPAAAVAPAADDSSSSEEDDGDGSAGGKDDDVEATPVSSKRRDLVSLFEDVGSEVRFIVCLFALF